MANNSFVESLFQKYNIPISKSKKSYKAYAEAYINSKINIEIDGFISYCRENWTCSPIATHIDNLTSGLLQGHSWHQSMPSMLHLSMQNKVRDCINGAMSLENLISIGADIMKHEYFMVAVHDICESTIINSFNECIPPTRGKSISDFIFNGIPYDLKVSNYPDGWHLPHTCNTSEEKISLIKLLYEGADTERMRKQAEGTQNNWGLNRFYVINSNQERWLSEPNRVINDIKSLVSRLREPLSINISEFHFLCQIIEI